MTEIITYACNAENGKDLCMDNKVALQLQSDAQPLKVAATKPEAQPEPACNSEQALHDPMLVAHMDAYTHGKFSGQGIGQDEIKAMLKSPEFTAHEKAELGSIGLMIPHVQDLLKLRRLQGQDRSLYRLGMPRAKIDFARSAAGSLLHDNACCDACRIRTGT